MAPNAIRMTLKSETGNSRKNNVAGRTAIKSVALALATSTQIEHAAEQGDAAYEEDVRAPSCTESISASNETCSSKKHKKAKKAQIRAQENDSATRHIAVEDTPAEDSAIVDIKDTGVIELDLTANKVKQPQSVGLNLSGADQEEVAANEPQVAAPNGADVSADASAVKPTATPVIHAGDEAPSVEWQLNNPLASVINSLFGNLRSPAAPVGEQVDAQAATPKTLDEGSDSRVVANARGEKFQVDTQYRTEMQNLPNRIGYQTQCATKIEPVSTSENSPAAGQPQGSLLTAQMRVGLNAALEHCHQATSQIAAAPLSEPAYGQGQQANGLLNDLFAPTVSIHGQPLVASRSQIVHPPFSMPLLVNQHTSVTPLVDPMLVRFAHPDRLARRVFNTFDAGFFAPRPRFGRSDLFF